MGRGWGCILLSQQEGQVVFGADKSGGDLEGTAKMETQSPLKVVLSEELE